MHQIEAREMEQMFWWGTCAALLTQILMTRLVHNETVNIVMVSAVMSYMYTTVPAVTSRLELAVLFCILVTLFTVALQLYLALMTRVTPRPHQCLGLALGIYQLNCHLLKLGAPQLAAYLTDTLGTACLFYVGTVSTLLTLPLVSSLGLS